jgi:hypothetical protein
MFKGVPDRTCGAFHKEHARVVGYNGDDAVVVESTLLLRLAYKVRRHAPQRYDPTTLPDPKESPPERLHTKGTRPVQLALPGAVLGDVGDPQSVGLVTSEAALDELGGGNDFAGETEPLSGRKAGPVRLSRMILATCLWPTMIPRPSRSSA